MLNDELLAILCCPETHQAVAIASPEIVRSLNDRIQKGVLKNQSGQKVSEPIDSALVREDNRIAYIVRRGVPIMLIDQAVPLE
jgi:uncharacterized protein YbaR (Trm112 family)